MMWFQDNRRSCLVFFTNWSWKRQEIRSDIHGIRGCCQFDTTKFLLTFWKLFRSFLQLIWSAVCKQKRWMRKNLTKVKRRHPHPLQSTYFRSSVESSKRMIIKASSFRWNRIFPNPLSICKVDLFKTLTATSIFYTDPEIILVKRRCTLPWRFQGYSIFLSSIISKRNIGRFSNMTLFYHKWNGTFKNSLEKNESVNWTKWKNTCTLTFYSKKTRRN